MRVGRSQLEARERPNLELASQEDQSQLCRCLLLHGERMQLLRLRETALATRRFQGLATAT